MISRRQFGYTGLLGLGVEAGFGQKAAILGAVPAGTVWLNANENPEGPPEASRQAIVQAVAEAGRYSHRVFPALHAALAKSVGVEPEQVIPGAGSTEILHCALDAFTTARRPLITAWPTWEMTRDVTLAAGKPVVQVPLLKDWSADVERMIAEANKAGGGVIHLGNPNNPTSSVTAGKAVRWLAENLPANTVLLLDEAYVDFTDPESGVSGMSLVREEKNVVVTRTFSKLYGMAGLRVGFGCAPAGLIQKMQPFRNNVISVVSARAAMAAVELGAAFVAERRARRVAVRQAFCGWLEGMGIPYIPPQANFVLMHLQRDVSEVIPRMLEYGVVTGRRFEGVPDWLRLTMGTAEEMEKSQRALMRVLLV